MRNLARTVCAAVAALALSSCAVVDNFSGRAVKYNLVAEEAQQQEVLLNIVRASLNRPMQFTTLSSITGTASVSGNETLTVPFGELAHRPKTGVSADVWGASATITGGPTFTVPVLDTQEFYQGELKPLSGQEYRFFLDEGITPSVLFYLFVDTITLKVAGGGPGDIFTFHSYVSDDFDNDQYEAVANYLLAMGLSIEQVHHNQIVGATLTAGQLHNLQDIAQLTTAGLHITQVPAGRKPTAATDTDTDATAKKAKNPVEAKGSGKYQITKAMTNYRPCFAQPGPTSTVRAVPDSSLICGSDDKSDLEDPSATTALTRSGGFKAPDLAAALATVRNRYIDGLTQKAKTLSSDQAASQLAIASQIRALPPLPGDKKLQVTLVMRSPEAILHFLGSIVARQLYPTYDVPRIIRVKIGEPYLPYSPQPCPTTADPNAPGDAGPGFRCENLFVLTLGQSTDSPLSVDYDGKSYAVPPDRIAGRTMRMLDLIKQILALHTSAKELPASNVLNIIGGAQ